MMMMLASCKKVNPIDGDAFLLIAQQSSRNKKAGASWWFVKMGSQEGLAPFVTASQMLMPINNFKKNKAGAWGQGPQHAELVLLMLPAAVKILWGSRGRSP